MTKKLIIVILVLLLIVGIYARLITTKEAKRYIKFNSIEWAKNNISRYYMLDSIVGQGILIGKHRNEVLDILGQPDMHGDFYSGEFFQYRTLQKDGDYLHWYLFIEINNDTVTRAQKSLD